MLKELTQNTNMAGARKNKLLIHHANVFHPKPLAITCITPKNIELVAVAKQHLNTGDSNKPVSILEIYKIIPKFAPRLIQSSIIDKTITGIAWINQKNLLIVTREQTILVWNLIKACERFNILTDYGPISCMKYSVEHDLLVTGTEYGYVAVYKVRLKSIEFVNKMVKVPTKIKSIDIWLRPRENVKFELLKQITDEPKSTTKKRKRNCDSSDESDNDETDVKDVEFLDSSEMTIYGSTLSEVVVWDYHKKTIIETIRDGDKSCQVLSILALVDGDLLVGDCNGFLTLFSHTTFTCRQTMKVLESGILCIATDDQEKAILVSGKEPTVVTLKRQEAIGDEFVLFERIEIHTHDVRCIVFTKRNEFITGGVDGLMIRCRLKEDRSVRTLALKKKLTLPNYHNRIFFSRGETMIQYDRSLVFWKLPKSDTNVLDDVDQLNPVKSLLLRARTYIHSSTFSGKWICYSSEKDVHIFNRLEEKLVSHRPDKKLNRCSLMKVCFDDRFLVACAGRELYLIDLSEPTTTSSKESNSSSTFRVVAEEKLRSNVRHLISFDNVLIIGCGPPKNMIYTFTFDPRSKTILKRGPRFPLQGHEISFLTHNPIIKRDTIYVYTSRDQIIKIGASESNQAEIFTRFNKNEIIRDLPDDANILGMVLVSEDSCILYDNHRMFKVDMAANKVINQSADYNYIVEMDNLVFGQADQIALVELTPEDYRKALPDLKVWKKFGH